MGVSEGDPFQFDFVNKKKFRFKNFLVVKSIHTIFKSNKVSCAKLFFKNIDFTTFFVVAVYTKK